MSRDSLDFYGAIVWTIARVAAVLVFTLFVWRLDHRGQAHDAMMLERHTQFLRQHETFMANHATLLRDHDRLMRDHDAAAVEHRTILQRLAR